jgi:DNA-binding NtrC family response regulator
LPGGLDLEVTLDGSEMSVQFQQGFAGSTRVATPLELGNFPHDAKRSTAARVLVVDDESLIRWSLAETLAGSGYEVTEAQDGASAIQAFASSHGSTDVVLLDLRLPDADDLRILAAMRQSSPEVPVIVMTAFGTPELLNEALRLGAFAVIDKPFDMSAISPLVERALATRLWHGG